jgi:hypothetical protein
MTREKALQVDKLLIKIEDYEEILDSLKRLDALHKVIDEYYDDDLLDELLAVVNTRLVPLLKELDAM